jgi:hypothetical protein
VPAEKLRAALKCGAGVDNARRAPVLLLHGTGATVEENWMWNYVPAFNSLGIPWCTLQSPERGQGDIQVNGEYVVHAIREMHRRAGRRISLIGHSQGGMLPRWALRFWPDTRAMVDDQIGFAASNHGTTQARITCREECSPSSWQQMDGSAFLRALNSFQETFAGISYTMVYTRLDEIVQPPDGAALHGGGGRITNVAIQDICPLALSEHLLIGIVDTTAFALAMDALSHDGPASVARVGANGCAQRPIPGLMSGALPSIALSYLTAPGVDPVPAEPPLRCFVTATCPASALPRLRVSVSPRRAVRGKMTRVRLTVRARVRGRLRAVRGARVGVGRKRARTDRRGRATLRLRFGRAGARRIGARAPGYAPASVVIRVR